MAPHQLLRDATYPELIDAWLSAIEPFASLAESLSPAQWEAPSILPGWTNADVVAHVVGIERDLLGEPVPAVDIEWDAYPHANDLFSRYTELSVHARRGVPQAEVCAELRKTIATRREWLVKEPGSLGDTVRGPGGWELPRGILIRMRCFDIWVHGQDIRASISTPGDLDTPAAWVAADRMLYGLTRTWARDVKAPIGSTVAVVVTGPGVEFTSAVTVDEQGRGTLIDPPAHPDLRLTMTWPTFASLTCGRRFVGFSEPTTDGHEHLAAALREKMNIAP